MADGGRSLFSSRRVTPAGDPAKSTPDAAALVGIGGALALIALATVLGGSPGSFVDIPAILIVVVGTLAVTLASFSFEEVGATAAMLPRALTRADTDAGDRADRLLDLADHARHNGLLKLQGAPLDGTLDDPFLHKGLSLVVDGVAEEEVEAMLRHEMEATAERHIRGASVLRRAAEVSPAMGLIGTLVGLVQMLGNLEDPARIGPSMAVALLTTFYGAILSNVVFAPLASKLERAAGEEWLVNHVTVLGVVSIARKENTRRLEMLLNSVLPPHQRVRRFHV
ncbi:motility protein A [Roseospira visakhapatnamensis]|uniref:Chemotaxis protein MotA n=1 Tax=Roseospira visakhapatnamensis TaxID=390880 RepID=A0A7W6RCC9_9PROT|nr:MotA/TolQ/ExbB proton channel family protein [Roseospira visakhapatnamensis]MBB4265394.1 chemotaxis protein MotA [Roseospira visakhapatnamensis]